MGFRDIIGKLARRDSGEASLSETSSVQNTREKLELLESLPVVEQLKARLSGEEYLPLVPLSFRRQSDLTLIAPTIVLTAEGIRVAWEPTIILPFLGEKVDPIEKLSDEVLGDEAVYFDGIERALALYAKSSDEEIRTMRKGRDFKTGESDFGDMAYNYQYSNVSLNHFRAASEVRDYCGRVEQLFEACGETFYRLQLFFEGPERFEDRYNNPDIQRIINEKRWDTPDLRTIATGLYFGVIDIDEENKVSCPPAFFHMTEDAMEIANGPVVPRSVKLWSSRTASEERKPVPATEVKFKICRSAIELEEFIGQREKLPEEQKEFINRYTLDELLDHDTFTVYLARDKRGAPIGAGFAISCGELVSVFSLPGLGLGEAVVDAAIQAGAIELVCLNVNGALVDLYERKGFRKITSFRFNRTLAPKGWDESKLGTPDLVHMIFDDLSFAEAALRRGEFSTKRVNPIPESLMIPVQHY